MLQLTIRGSLLTLHKTEDGITTHSRQIHLADGSRRVLLDFQRERIISYPDPPLITLDDTYTTVPCLETTVSMALHCE